MWLEIVLHNGLDTEVYDLHPADYTTTTTTTLFRDLERCQGHISIWCWLFQTWYELQTVSMEYLYGLTHALLNSVISNDHDWLSEIFNDTKHRTVFLRQLSYLCCLFYSSVWLSLCGTVTVRLSWIAWLLSQKVLRQSYRFWLRHWHTTQIFVLVMMLSLLMPMRWDITSSCMFSRSVHIQHLWCFMVYCDILWMIQTADMSPVRLMIQAEMPVSGDILMLCVMLSGWFKAICQFNWAGHISLH